MDNLSETKAVIFIFLFAGCITVLITSTIVNKSAVIATMVGYSIILAGMLYILGYTSYTSAFSMQKKMSVITASILIILVLLISIYLLNTYIHEIATGHIPYLTTFSFLSAIFVTFQLYMIKNFISSFTDIKSIDSAKLYGFSLVSLILLMCMYTSLKYYVTDG